MRRVGCAILAAGASRRLGRPKQLLRWRGNELIRHLALQALYSRADEIAVIVGAHADHVVAAVSELPLRCLVNLEWREGVASSIRCAAHWATQRGLSALVLMTCDQPHLEAKHLDSLIAEHESGVMQVASRYGGVIGVPALFDATVFHRLFTLHGDAGAATILRNERSTCSIEWPAGEIDIDTARDLALLSDETEAARQHRRQRNRPARAPRSGTVTGGEGPQEA
jgi:molybdenum cofactor cytidylyltransferase